MKRVLTILLMLSLVFLMFVGCSENVKTDESKKTNESETTNETKKEHKTVVLSTISGYYNTALKEVAKEYSDNHPETTVEIEIIADNTAYLTNWTSKMTAGGENAPDIIHTNLLGDWNENVKKGWIAKLNDFVQEENEYNDGKTVFEGIDSEYHQYAYTPDGDVATLTFDLVGSGFYYNKNIFEKLGLEAPSTWEELFEVCQAIEDAGIIPMAMPVDPYEGFLRSAFVDWNARSLYPQLLILPGDARYDEEIHNKNTEIKYKPENPNFDLGAVYDPEKKILAIKDDLYDMKGEAERTWWTTLKTMAQYYQPGYQTQGPNAVYSLFISQKAAIHYNGSWMIGSILADQKELGDKAFEWGTFKFPEYAEPNPLFPGKPRGFLVPGHNLGLTQKEDTEQMGRAKDFLKYLYSKDVAQYVFERTIEVGEFVQGPSLIKGVSLPEEMNSYLTGFLVNGNMGHAIDDVTQIYDADQAAAWKDNLFDFYEGNKTVEEFLEAKAELANERIDNMIKKFEYDLDPATNP